METTARKPLRATKVEEVCGGWVTLEAGSKRLGLTYAEVYETIRRRQVAVQQIGKTILFRPDELERERAKAAKERRK